MNILKQSTEVTVMVGPFLDKTDGVTEEAGLAGTASELSKAGAAFGAGPNLGTYDSDGWYPLTLTTTHTNTLGELVIKVHDSATHLPVWAKYKIVPAQVYDAFVAGTDKLDTGVAESVTGAVGSVTGAVGSVTGNVGGNVTGSVGSVVGAVGSAPAGGYM